MLRNSFGQHDNTIAVNHSHLIMLVRYRQAKILDSCCNWMIFQDMNADFALLRMRQKNRMDQLLHNRMPFLQISDGSMNCDKAEA